MDYNKIFRSKTFKITFWSIGGLIVALVIFWAGMFVGYNKAGFSYRWGENYQRNFGGPRGDLSNDLGGRGFIIPHGVDGQIIKIDSSSLIIKGLDNVEKVVLVDNNTIIRELRNNIKLSALKINDYVVIIGDPNNSGQIQAKFIRLMPEPPENNPMMDQTPPPPPSTTTNN